ncbi:trypsin-like serine peptidase [Streptomyces formicae]|uniref:trypsin-like serine peptidase n=1 Tax=Streptomyces formicae TaxID=1616117 RepID=UPI00360839DA
MSTKKRTVDRLPLAEEGERPLTPFELAQLRPSLGTGEPPPAMVELANHKRIHVIADGSPPEPVVRRMDEAGENMWRVDVHVGPEGDVALPGRTATRSLPEELLSEIDPNVDLCACRPEWLDMFYVPRLLPSRREEPIRRLRGGLIQPEAVFPPEGRSDLAETSFPWGNVGKIVNNEGNHGSGALVGDRLVLTAGHVVPWQSEEWWMRFVPAYYNGQSLHGAGVRSYVSDVQGYNPDLSGGESAGYDWAICRLYEPLGTVDRLGHFGTKTYNPAWNGQGFWNNMGYPINMWFLGASLQGFIAVEDTDDDINGGLEIEHYGDTTKGNSGGPLFAFFGEGQPRITAVQSGYQAEDEDMGPINVAAGGPGMSRLVAWGRTNWP